ncbi:MAG: GtrA family protein [Ferruginibacter sp.]
MKERITTILDFFYPPFKKIMPLQTFRYAACGGGNTLLGLFIYWICIRYFNGENVNLGITVLKPHNAALFASSVVSITVGFILSKYLVFLESNLKGHIQLFRYVLSFFMNIVINYFLLKLFVEKMNMPEFTGQLIATVFVILFSYFSQKNFSFRAVG